MQAIEQKKKTMRIEWRSTRHFQGCDCSIFQTEQGWSTRKTETLKNRVVRGMYACVRRRVSCKR